jgi:hypothetical protein
MSKPMPKELIALTRTHRLLSEAKTFEDFKAIRDKAQAARLYAKSARLGFEIQLHAAEVKLECERRAGSLLSEMELSHGGRPSKNNRSQAATSLDDLGINKSQSSRWQDQARLPEEEFRKYLADCRAAGREPTSQGLLNRSRQFGGKGLAPKFHARTAKVRRSNTGSILNSPGVLSVPCFDSEDDESTVIADLYLHHKQLVDSLASYCADGPFSAPTIAQRRYICHLLSEMGDCLANLRRFREDKASKAM